MIISQQVIDTLCEQAAQSPRLRANLDLRTSAEDGSQRMLNAVQPRTNVPIHRHPSTSETVILVQGSLEEIFYDENGMETSRILLSKSGSMSMVNIPAGQWHTINVLEMNTVMFEAKDGAYQPLTDKDILK